MSEAMVELLRVKYTEACQEMAAVKEERDRYKQALTDSIEALSSAHDVFIDEWNAGNKLPQFDAAMKDLLQELKLARAALQTHEKE